MNTFEHVTVILAIVAGNMLSGQEVQLADPNPPPSAHHKEVFWNAMKLRLELTLDRTSYLRGETLWAYTAVWNPTTEPLEVFTPRSQTGLGLLHWADRFNTGTEGWEPATPDNFDQAEVNWEAPTITLGPGQRIEHRFIPHLFPCPGCERRFAVYGPTDELSPRYLLRYCCAGLPPTCAEAEYSVVDAAVVQVGSVKLKRTADVTDPATGETKHYPLYAYGMILQSGQTRYITLSRRTAGGADLPIGTNEKLGLLLNYVTPYDRLAEGASDAADLKIVEDAAENITVSWRQNFRTVDSLTCWDNRSAKVDKNRSTAPIMGGGGMCKVPLEYPPPYTPPPPPPPPEDM